jgi:hypothetical protein
MFDFLMSNTFWIMLAIFLVIFLIGFLILFFLLYIRTHLKLELKSFFTKTPIGIFYQDNKFFDMKLVTPIKGLIYDKEYGPFIVSTTYVDKRTKRNIMAFDVDMDSDRTVNIKELIDSFQDITNNEKNIEKLRTYISGNTLKNNKQINNIKSYITTNSLKKLFFNSAPHSIKSKIEKIVSEKIRKYSNANPMQAVIIFGAIFGIIILGAILLKSTGVMN